MISLCIQVILSQTKFITKNKGNNKQVIYKNGYQLLYCIVIWKIEFGVNVKCDFNIRMSFKKVAYVPRKNIIIQLNESLHNNGAMMFYNQVGHQDSIRQMRNDELNEFYPPPPKLTTFTTDDANEFQADSDQSHSYMVCI